MQVAVAERLRRIGVCIPQCDILTTLTEQEGVSQQELAKRLDVTKGNISGLLDRLESAGFVERREAAADRRQYSIYLPHRGRPGDGAKSDRRADEVDRLDARPHGGGRPRGAGDAARRAPRDIVREVERPAEAAPAPA